MWYRGKEIDPIALWSNYCNVKVDDGPWLPLTFCPNPSHNNTRTPAFGINIEKSIVKCFADCGITGSYAHAISIITGCTERESRKVILKHAITKIAGEKYNSVNKSKINSSNNRKEAAAEESPSDEDLNKFTYLPKDAIRFLESRGVEPNSRAWWELGFDERANRVTIPVFDNRRRLQFIIRRGIYRFQRPSYLYPKGASKSSLLFGTCNLDLAMVDSQGVILVEGSLDAIKMHQYGFRNTVAILGSSLSLRQREELARLQPKTVYLFFDKDAAGIRAMRGAAKMLTKYPIKVPLYPKGRSDPAELTSREANNSIKGAIPLLDLKRRIRNAKREELAIGSNRYQ